jgi:hypothetical protein
VNELDPFPLRRPCLKHHLFRYDLLSRKSLMSSNVQGQRSSSTPGSGISRGYNSNSLAVEAVIVVFVDCPLSIYISIEPVFITFTRYKSVCFSSLLTVSLEIIPYTLTFRLEFLQGHCQLGQVYKRVSTHDQMVNNGHLARASCCGVGYIRS